MLTKRERSKVLKFIRVWCKVGLLPFEVDLTNWELKAPSLGKQILCNLSYCCLVLHAIYKSASLAYTYLFVSDVQLHQLIIHVIVVLGFMLVAFWYHMLCYRYPALFAAFVKMTLVGNVGGTGLGWCDQLERRWRRKLTEYSLQDLIAMTLPYTCVICGAFIVATYAYDPSMRLLLYAALPNQLQNWATFGMCLLEEIRLISLGIAVLGPMWQLQVISFDLVCNQLRQSIRKIENGGHTCRSVYKFLRCLQLYMAATNNINSHLIFTWKLLSITVSIISGYAAIAHFREHPVFGCMYYVILAESTVTYSVIYQKAFRIPELFKRTVGCALLRRRGDRPGIFGRQMRSIPPTGVKVGNFHTMERVSTLIYMNYVVVNIVNLLVAFG